MTLKADEAREHLKMLLSESETHKYKLKFQAEMAGDKSYGYFWENGIWFCFDNRYDYCTVLGFVSENSAIGWCNGEELNEEGLRPFSFYQDSQVRMFEQYRFTVYAACKDEALDMVRGFDRNTLKDNKQTVHILEVEHDYLFDTGVIIDKEEIQIFDGTDNCLVSEIHAQSDALSEIMKLAIQLAGKALIDFYHLPYDELSYADPEDDTVKLKEKYTDQYNQFYDFYYDKLMKL